MKLNPSFLTHVTKGEHYLIAMGDVKFKGIVKNNQTAAFIVECLKQDVTEEAIVKRLMEEYSEADPEIVRRDVGNVIGKLRSIGAIVE